MEGPDALTRLRESQKAAARAGRRAKAASLYMYMCMYMSPGGYSQGFVPEGW